MKRRLIFTATLAVCGLLGLRLNELIAQGPQLGTNLKEAEFIRAQTSFSKAAKVLKQDNEGFLSAQSLTDSSNINSTVNSDGSPQISEQDNADLPAELKDLWGNSEKIYDAETITRFETYSQSLLATPYSQNLNERIAFLDLIARLPSDERKRFKVMVLSQLEAPFEANNSRSWSELNAKALETITPFIDDLSERANFWAAYEASLPVEVKQDLALVADLKSKVLREP